MAQAFDAPKLRLSGEPFPLFQRVYFNPPMFGSRVVSVSNDGVLSFLRGSAMVALQRFDRSGKLIEPVGDPGENLRNLALSPDGKRLVAAMGLPTTDLWMYDLASGNRSRFTFDPAVLHGLGQLPVPLHPGGHPAVDHPGFPHGLCRV